ncbi:MAG: SPFH domain-containing protein [Candidatus Diapherotrites archaeon]|uniref:SPFH domain-containing protein n=1 Tax=Candidatus Iainarchaeum sp. TaxID=3101447 RepID=A0A8T4L1J2_9ARCH|nr:SPFH domain-containing protein [Candidatus Diapherotrites archaeon]
MAKRFGKVESHKIKQIIFALFVVVLLFLVYLSWTSREAIVPIVFAAFAVLIVAFLVNQYDFLLTLKEYERAVIFRFGKVSRVGGPGWTMIIPLIESFKIVDLRTQTIDVPPQEVITADQVVVKIDALVYLFVKPDSQSVINSVIEVKDYLKSAEGFVVASVRDLAGTLTLQELVSNIAKLNEAVQKALERVATNWGVGVEAVAISDIKLPEQLERALTEQKAAEQMKLARMQSAEAHRIEIDAVRIAAEQLSDKALAYYYIRALEKVSEGSASKIFFPIELSKLATELSSSMSRSQVNPELLESLFRKYAPAIKKLAKESK